MPIKKCPACGNEREFEYLGKKMIPDGIHVTYSWKCVKCGEGFTTTERITSRVLRAGNPELERYRH